MQPKVSELNVPELCNAWIQAQHANVAGPTVLEARAKLQFARWAMLKQDGQLQLAKFRSAMRLVKKLARLSDLILLHSRKLRRACAIADTAHGSLQPALKQVSRQQFDELSDIKQKARQAEKMQDALRLVLRLTSLIDPLEVHLEFQDAYRDTQWGMDIEVSAWS